MRNACIVGLLGMFVLLGCGSSEEPTAATPTATPTPTDALKKRSPEAIEAKRAAQPNAEITQGKLPEGFPSDVPMFPDAQPKTSMMVGDSGLIVLTSNASLSDVLSHFREKLPSQGWTVDSVTEGAGGNKAAVRAHKNSRQTTISISTAEDGGTEIGITLKAS